MRALLCSAYGPSDGIEVNFTSLTKDGIVPSEKPLPEVAMVALPPNHTVSNDATLDRLVMDLAGQKKKTLLPELLPEEQKAADAF